VTGAYEIMVMPAARRFLAETLPPPAAFAAWEFH
jgi:hypothetical protein